MHRGLIIASVVVVVIAISLVVWMSKDTAKLSLTSGSVSSGVFNLGYSYTGKQNPANWVGKTITIHSPSLGSTVKAAVASATTTSLTTTPSSYAGSYSAAAGDYARIY